MALPPRLDKELSEVQAELQVDVQEEADFINLILRCFRFGDGFNLPAADLLLRIPRSYPDAGPDMFWTSPDLTLSDGRAPQSAEHIESYVGRRWRRFSWHKAAWNPRIDNLHGYLQFIRRRLHEKK